MDPLAKVKSGEPFRPSAATFNELIDAARLAKLHEAGMRADAAELYQASPVLVRIINRTETHWPRMSIVGLADPVPTPDVDLVRFKNELTFAGRVPTAADVGRFAVLRDPIPPSHVGEGVLAGFTVAQVNLTTGKELFAEAIAGDVAKLVGGLGSARILWKPGTEEAPATGAQWCVVRLGATSTRPAFTAKATLTAALSDATGTITGFTVTSPPPFTAPPDPLPTSVANPFKHRGQPGGQVQLLFDADADEWQVIDVEKTVVKLAVGVGGVGPLRASGNKLQLYLTEVATEYATAPAWEDMVPGTGCPAP